MEKIFNLYCDESCHLKNNGNQVSMLGYVGVYPNKINEHKLKIKEIKIKHKMFTEIKWTKVSKSKILFYRDLLDYFLASDMIFRGLIIPTDHQHQTHRSDKEYYALYKKLLNHKSNLNYKHNIYIDFKDTNSPKKVKEMHDELNLDSTKNYGHIQTIRSYESIFIQLADLIIGAYSYDLNVKDKVLSKESLADILTKSAFSADHYEDYKKISAKNTNLFLIEIHQY